MSSNAQKTPIGRALNELAERRNADAAHIVGKRLPCSVTKVEGAIVTVKFEVITKFTLPKVRVPIEGSIYARAPTQIGDKGYVQAADARLGGVTALGTGTADLTPPTNLGALVFVPLGNADWDAAPDPDKFLIQGPKGFYFRDLPVGDEDETFSLVGDKDAKTVTTKVGEDASLVVADDNITAKFGDDAVVEIVDGQITIKVTDDTSIVVDQDNVTITGNTQVKLVVGGSSITITSGGIDIEGVLTINGHAYLAHKHSGVATGVANSGGVVP